MTQPLYLSAIRRSRVTRILVATCALFTLAMASFSSQVMAKETTLTIWTSSENVARAIEQLTPQFEKEFQTKVQVSVLNKDLTTQFKTAAIAGKGPDIFCWANDVVGELASSGLIEPIHLTHNQRSEFLKSSLDSFTYNGLLYGYPYDIEAVALIINTDLLKEAPTSMEELMLWSKEFQKKTPGSYGLLFDIKNFYFNFSLISANGGYVFGPADPKNPGKLDPLNIGLANDGAIKGVSFLKKLKDEGIVPSSSDRNVAFEKFLKGKLAATIDGPWAIKDIQRAKIPYQVLPIPSLYGGTPHPFVGTHGLIIRRSSPNKELAKELIEKYIVTDHGLATLYKEDPRGPSRQGTLDILKKSLNKEEQYVLGQFFQSASHGMPMPNLSEMAPVWSAMGSAFDLIFNNDIDPSKALNQAKDKILLSIKDNQND